MMMRGAGAVAGDDNPLTASALSDNSLERAFA
jgi:hypothetical protein